MTSPVDIRPDQLEIVQDILLKHLPAGVKVWVFGSRANWTTKDSSDLDLALEGESKLSHKVLGALEDAFKDSSLPYTVDVVDLNRIGDSFRQIVESQRVPLLMDGGDDTGQTLSNGWRDVTLGGLIDIRHGFAFKGKFIHDEPRGDLLLTPGNFAIGGGFKRDKFKYYDGPVEEDYVLREGDLLVTMTDLSKQSDTLGYPALVPICSDEHRYLHNQRLGKIVTKETGELHTGFLYYLMCSAKYRHEVLASATGTTVKHTSPDRIRQFRFSLPPLSKQRAIAHVLGTLDDKIDLNRRMNETLEAMARALFKSWFVDFEPVRAKMDGRWRRGESLPGLSADLYDLFPDRLVASELGEIPEGWEVKRIEDLAERVAMGPFGSSIKVSTFVDTGVPIISGQHLKGILLEDGDYRFITEDHAKRLARSNVQRGDVVFTHAGSIGQVAYIPGTSQYERYVISQRQFYLRCDRSTISPLFVVHFFKTQEGQHQLLANTSSTGVPSIARPVTYLRSIRLCVPPKALWTTFHHTVSGFYAAVARSAVECYTIATLRDALLSKLVSGEIRVVDLS